MNNLNTLVWTYLTVCILNVNTKDILFLEIILNTHILNLRFQVKPRPCNSLSFFNTKPNQKCAFKIKYCTFFKNVL
jgi:hypothetical protein